MLGKIGELYSGASAAPHFNSFPGTPYMRQGSLGRQNTIICHHEGNFCPILSNKQIIKDSESTASQKSLKRGQIDKMTFRSFNQEMSEDQEMSEGNIFLCANIVEELEVDQEVWKKSEEMQSSTSEHSLHTSSEHFSKLFGHHQNSPSNSSSMVGWRPLGNETKEESFECDCAANCPFSCNSGYHTMESGANDLIRVPSRTLSCSTVPLTDFENGYLDPQSSCEDCPSSGDAFDLGSSESLDREWTDHSVGCRMIKDVGNSFSHKSSEKDFDGKAKTANVGFDIKLSTAVVTCKCALKDALKQFEVSNPEEMGYDNRTRISLHQLKLPNEQNIADNIANKAGLTEKEIQVTFPAELRNTYAYVDFEIPKSNSPSKRCCSTCSPSEHHTTEISLGKESDEYLSSTDSTDHSTTVQQECFLGVVLGTNNAGIGLTKEKCPFADIDNENPTDASHKERIANFQRILKEKKQIHHRLSRSLQGSQGSYGSQGSQGSQFHDVFQGIWKFVLSYW